MTVRALAITFFGCLLLACPDDDDGSSVGQDQGASDSGADDSGEVTDSAISSDLGGDAQVGDSASADSAGADLTEDTSTADASSIDTSSSDTAAADTAQEDATEDMGTTDTSVPDDAGTDLTEVGSDAGTDEDAGELCADLTDGALIVFGTSCEGDQTFTVWVTDDTFINEAITLEGMMASRVPVFTLTEGTGCDGRYGWSVQADNPAFADFTIELCDGCPDFVEEQLTYWLESVGSYCPWSGRVISVDDRRVGE